VKPLRKLAKWIGLNPCACLAAGFRPEEWALVSKSGRALTASSDPLDLKGTTTKVPYQSFKRHDWILQHNFGQMAAKSLATRHISSGGQFMSDC